jgi:hypothetical protein
VSDANGAYQPQVAGESQGAASAIWTAAPAASTLRVESAGRRDFTPYPQPFDGRRVRVSFVTAFKQCVAPNVKHGTPLVFDSCKPPAQSAGYATVPTSGVSNAARATGVVRVICTPDPPGTFEGCTPAGDQRDLALSANAFDVRKKSDPAAEYVGELELRLNIRITDLWSDAGPATVVDFDFPVTVPCTTTADATGSACTATTTADALLPNAVREGKEAMWALGDLELYDGGPDGDADTIANNTLFMRQGFFAP